MAMVQDQDPGRWVSWATRFLVYRQHIPTLLLVHKGGREEEEERDGDTEEKWREWGGGRREIQEVGSTLRSFSSYREI